MATSRQYYQKKSLEKNSSMLFLNLKGMNYHGCYKGQEIWEDFFLSSIPPKKQQNSFPISVLASKKWSNQKN